MRGASLAAALLALLWSSNGQAAPITLGRPHLQRRAGRRRAARRLGHGHQRRPVRAGRGDQRRRAGDPGHSRHAQSRLGDAPDARFQLGFVLRKIVTNCDQPGLARLRARAARAAGAAQHLRGRPLLRPGDPPAAAVHVRSVRERASMTGRAADAVVFSDGLVAARGDRSPSPRRSPTTRRRTSSSCCSGARARSPAAAADAAAARGTSPRCRSRISSPILSRCCVEERVRRARVPARTASAGTWRRR